MSIRSYALAALNPHEVGEKITLQARRLQALAITWAWVYIAVSETIARERRRR